jgi:polyhydroxyalkanoate synthesis regulator phasin
VDIKSILKSRGQELLADPKVQKVLQDPRVMGVAMQAFQLRGKVQEQLDERVEQAAKTLGLVTKNDVRELKRTIKKLETELKKTQDSLLQKKS